MSSYLSTLPNEILIMITNTLSLKDYVNLKHAYTFLTSVVTYQLRKNISNYSDNKLCPMLYGSLQQHKQFIIYHNEFILSTMDMLTSVLICDIDVFTKACSQGLGGRLENIYISESLLKKNELSWLPKIYELCPRLRRIFVYPVNVEINVIYSPRRLCSKNCLYKEHLAMKKRFQCKFTHSRAVFHIYMDNYNWNVFYGNNNVIYACPNNPRKLFTGIITEPKSPLVVSYCCETCKQPLSFINKSVACLTCQYHKKGIEALKIMFKHTFSRKSIKSYNF